MEHLFKYVVKGVDCDGAGYQETWVEYEGFDREKALAAKRECENKSIFGIIRLLTPGPKGWRDRRQEELQKKVEEELEEEWLQEADEEAEYLKEKWLREVEEEAECLEGCYVPVDNETKEKKYQEVLGDLEPGDILSIEQVSACLFDGYGDPGPADIAVLNHVGWYPIGFCTESAHHLIDPDETEAYSFDDYGKTWIAVYNGREIDGWAAADCGTAYLFDV